MKSFKAKLIEDWDTAPDIVKFLGMIYFYLMAILTLLGWFLHALAWIVTHLKIQ